MAKYGRPQGTNNDPAMAGRTSKLSECIGCHKRERYLLPYGERSGAGDRALAFICTPCLLKRSK